MKASVVAKVAEPCSTWYHVQVVTEGWKTWVSWFQPARTASMAWSPHKFFLDVFLRTPENPSSPFFRPNKSTLSAHQPRCPGGAGRSAEGREMLVGTESAVLREGAVLVTWVES